MQSFAIVLPMLLVSCHALAYGGDKAGQSRKITNYRLTGLLESVREIMLTGNETIGIPVLDPFQSEQERINFEKKDLIDVDLLLKNINVEGLSTYKVDVGDFQMIGLKIDVGLTWPQVSAQTGYVTKGNLVGKIDFHGDGDLSAVVSDFSFGVAMNLRVRGKRLELQNVKTRLSLGKLEVVLTGLYDDGDFSNLISTVVSEITPGLIDDYQTDITGFTNGIITKVGNEFLKDMTLRDLLDLIG